ncbi:MAG: endonuclease MutS2 [Lachnospiraceae bacterium]|nr:endonuclease MutS2 [Lachnospiraceae bacterium]
MNEKVLSRLEYHKIISMLTDLASTREAKDLCENTVPLKDRHEIERLQDETEAALNRIFKNGSLKFGGVKNIRSAVQSSVREFILSPIELMDIASTLETCSRIRQYGKDAPEDILSDRFECLEPIRPLSDSIRRSILSEEEIADDASPELKSIRRRIKQSNDRIRSELNSMINGPLSAYLMEPVITQRGGRFCVPVRSEHKAQVPGMVHDTSSTGSTLFIEPAAAVKLNNDIRELMLAEKEEISRILASLSQEVSDHAEQLLCDLDILTELDYIFARASLAADMNAMRPIFTDDLHFELKNARHPLIPAKDVVPIHVWLGKDFHLLVVTGPNTGGKTVTLKTVGLLHLMGLSGLFIPASDGSELALFDEIFADIGDEQSIEQSLSTFSSHMTNIVSILRAYTKDSLCLFDELGAGTDPEEGAALAQSILNFLHVRNIRTIATTHYSELKIYALNTPGVENASQEFDVETLQPTYHLLIGVPGKSNAFAISKRLGLPGYVIEEAERRMDETDRSFEDVLDRLDNARKELEDVRREADTERKRAEELRKELDRKYSRLEKDHDRILSDAKEEARQILASAKEEADAALRNIQKYGLSADKEGIRALEADRSRLRESLKEKDTGSSSGRTSGIEPGKIRLGMPVEIVSSGFKGTVSTLPDHKGNLVVLCGIIKYRTNCADLTETTLKDPYDKKTAAKPSSGAGLSHAMTISPELNIIGQTTSDGISRLIKYLDEAYMSHLEEVRIVHGKGTGALRNAVRDELKKIRYVKSFRSGEYGEGDAGVTVVTLKK